MRLPKNPLRRPAYLRPVSPETEAKMRELIANPNLRRLLMDSDFEGDPWGAAAVELAGQQTYAALGDGQ